MILEKIAQTSQSLKKSIIETFKLLLSFKWYVILYLLYISIYIFALIYSPEESHPIYRAEATNNDWRYTNQEVYIGSLKLELLNICLIFLLAVSYMKRHSSLAKILLLLPIFYSILVSGINYN